MDLYVSTISGEKIKPIQANQHDKFRNASHYYEHFRDEIEPFEEFDFKGGIYYWHEGKKSSYMVCVKHPEATNYIRVVGDFYKWITDASGKKRLSPWDAKAIAIDYADIKGFKQMVDSYDGFCLEPDNNEYKPVINNLYNMYNPITHKLEAGEFPYIHAYFQHLFGDSFEMAYDYFSILWQFPKQKLPIISLVSEENGTGKSTLLFLMKYIFGDNCSILGNSEINSDFNATYATKVLVCLDESFIEKRVVLERIKSLNTAPFIWLNEKGVKQKQVDCHCHFILTSNNESNFVMLDEYDTRFWVIKVAQPKTKTPDLLALMKDEIPAFLHFLNTRDIVHPKSDRFWFAPELFETDAKRRVVEASIPQKVRILKDWLSEYFEIHKFKTVYFNRMDLQQILKNEGFNTVFDGDFFKKYIKFDYEGKVQRRDRNSLYNSTVTNETQRFFEFHAINYLDRDIYDELFATEKEKTEGEKDLPEVITVAPF